VSAHRARYRHGVTTSQKERTAFNEALFRAGNERMHAFEEREDAPPDERHMCLCECGDTDCKGRLWLTADEYEAIRTDDMRFAVLVGHITPEAERVVSEHEGRYLVVEKHEDVRGIVEREHGPRVG
jgi:hypothetical protein